MCVNDRHDMTLAVKVALNPNTTNQPTNQALGLFWGVGVYSKNNIHIVQSDLVMYSLLFRH